MKPICYYKEALLQPMVGQCTLVVVDEHPLLGPKGGDFLVATGVVRTSPIVALNDDGFETENTIYEELFNAVP